MLPTGFLEHYFVIKVISAEGITDVWNPLDKKKSRYIIIENSRNMSFNAANKKEMTITAIRSLLFNMTDENR
jgi:hypothetical protein